MSISDEELDDLKDALNMSHVDSDQFDKADQVLKELIDHYNATKELYWLNVDDYELHEQPKGRYLLYTPYPDPVAEYRLVDQSMLRHFIDATHFMKLSPPTPDKQESE